MIFNVGSFSFLSYELETKKCNLWLGPNIYKLASHSKELGKIRGEKIILATPSEANAELSVNLSNAAMGSHQL